MSFKLVEATKLVVMGERMTEFIWYWKKGNTKVFTKNTDVAEKAMKDGKLVMGTKIKPTILRF
jgi:hypothetical protein